MKREGNSWQRDQSLQRLRGVKGHPFLRNPARLQREGEAQTEAKVPGSTEDSVLLQEGTGVGAQVREGCGP